MTGEERRNRIQQRLQTDTAPVSGSTLARELQVSRQVIVQDIALLRAEGYQIDSTYKGYLITQKPADRIFKVCHKDDEVEDELNLIVDCGGRIQDVFIYHKVYGLVKAPLQLRSRREIKAYMEELRTGASSLLKNATSGYHYHTVQADSQEILDLIGTELQEKGYLAPLQDYEPKGVYSIQDPSQKPSDPSQ